MKTIIFTLLFLTLAFTAQQQQQKKKCPGHFSKPVANLCASHFPDATSEKVWLIKFYAPWCGHCNAMKGKYTQLAKELKDNKDIGIGAVDCTAQESQALCQRNGVQGYPTIKAFVNGKPKNYQGARETEPMKQYILNLAKNKGSGGGSSKCQKGVFKSGVRDAVVPLCSKHFPDNKSKNSWVIAFYNSKDFKDKEVFNQVASELGNEPAEKLKKAKVVMKQRDRLTKLQEKYEELNVKLPNKGPISTFPFAKAGGVCCDCDDESKQFCAQQNISSFPTYKFVTKNGEKSDFTGSLEKSVELLSFTLDKLGFIKQSEKEHIDL